MIEKFIWEVCDVIAGQSPEGKFYNKEEDGLPFYQGKKEFTDKYIGKPTTWTTKVTKEAFKDDILMSVRAPVGPVNFSTRHICIGRGLAAIRAKEEINKDYLFYFLIYHENLIVGNKGAVFNSINKKQIENLKVPLPSKLEEQKQIVEILNKAFESIEQAKINIEKNIENTKELFQSRLNEIFSQKGDGWEEKKLEELANDKKAIVSGPFGSNLKVADYRDSGVPIIRLQNVGKGYFIEKDIKYIEKEKAEELKSHSFVVGDIVLAKLGIPIGKTCIIPDTFSDGIILADIVRIRPDKKKVNYKFLEYFLNTDLSVSQLTKNISGATRPRVNLSNVRNIIVHIPSLEIQNKLVIEIDKLSEQTKQLEKQYKQKLNNLEELKKSILQKAFSGELIP